jgi:hypothetical protein
VSARTKAILAALVERAEVGAWDQHPVLYRLHAGPDGVSLVDFQIEAKVWASAPAPTVLSGMAGIMVGHGFTARPHYRAGPLVGVAFRHEGWWVENDPADQRGMQRTAKMAGEHRLRHHPDRVEVRQVIAVDRHGVTYVAMHKRGRDTEQVMMLPGRDEVRAAGAVIEALDAMVFALCGSTPPPRPSSYVQSTEHLN